MRTLLWTMAGLIGAAALASCGGGGAGGKTCPASQVLCGVECVDPLTERAYCGADSSCQGYSSCASGEVCVAGACATSCPTGQVVCGDRCVDPLSDRAYCGADSSCQGYNSCASGDVCVAGACATSCPAGQVVCGNRCVDPLSDRAHCGADSSCQGYTACGSGEVCASGTCATSCPAGQVVCGDRCVDPLSDRSYCGANMDCQGGTACGSGELCVAGGCVTTCPVGQYACNGRCVDPLTDRTHCGTNAGCASGTVCAVGQACTAGHCATSCPAGQVVCGNRCVDPTSDPTYCGAAADCTGGQACGTGSFCQSGSCWSPCGAGKAYCAQTCVDPTVNRGFCGAVGLCNGAASGHSCDPDQLCADSACTCPEGQSLCSDGTCQFVCAEGSRPSWEWKASVPLTSPPRFRETSSTLAHIVFDGSNMVDLTGHTSWAPVGSPPASANGMWTPAQLASGPFSATAYWLGSAASRDYLKAHTSGAFTVCARYRAGIQPGASPNKIIMSLGKPELMPSSTASLGGWALMQMHDSACFHYYDGAGGEWMLPSAWGVDGNTLRSFEWVWQCGGWDGTSLASLRNSSYASGAMYWNQDGSKPLVAGFPATIELPAIGNYPDGTGPLGDGAVYEIIITSDPATEFNMKNLVARASGGLRLDNQAGTPVVGADGATHLGAPSTALVEVDGSVLANQGMELGAVLPASPEPVLNGQCWGMDASASDWASLDANTTLLKWSSADRNREYRINWFPGPTICMDAVQPSPWTEHLMCWSSGVLVPGRHQFHYCVGPELVGAETKYTRRLYIDGVQPEAKTDVVPVDYLPHLEDAASSFSLGNVSANLKLWRVWVCPTADPAACP